MHCSEPGMGERLFLSDFLLGLQKEKIFLKCEHFLKIREHFFWKSGHFMKKEQTLFLNAIF